jgi:hypothetical protein
MAGTLRAHPSKKTPHWYRCESCDVAGYDTHCWVCGVEVTPTWVPEVPLPATAGLSLDDATA